MEPAADDVVEAAGRHPVERRGDHGERLLVAAPEEELERRGGRELRRAPEAAERGLERPRDRARGVVENRRLQRLGRRRRDTRTTRSAASMRSAWLSMSSLRARHVSATARSTSGKLASPCRGSGGKYVPAKNGRASGVMKTVVGQPPEPVIPTAASIVTASTSGRSSRSTFTFTNSSFMSAAVVALSNDSCAITWHQWHEL